MTSQIAAMAADLVVDLRQIAPIVRMGWGSTNGTALSPRCDPNGGSTAN